jgi:mono/diheme cytochrome c family protein
VDGDEDDRNRPTVKLIARSLRWTVVLAALLACAAALITYGRGFGTRGTPGTFESAVMRGLRSWAMPSSAAKAVNPVSPTADAIAEGRAHWADHCATCHANDGAGSPLGRSFYPPVPDLRAPTTQALSDGDLFYIIERGIPFTGMPSWGNGTADGEHDSWELVRFIRHLPALTPDELDDMDRLNPKSPSDAARDRDIDRFLNGAPPDAPAGMDHMMKDQPR